MDKKELVRHVTGFVIVILDSLRADAVDLSENGDTPHIAALAARGTTFERAVAPAAWTLPSHVSMMTGLLPTEHQIQARGTAKAAMRHARSSLSELAERDMLLPRWLADKGVDTFLGSANVWVSQASGLGRYFGDIAYAPFPPRKKPLPSATGGEARPGGPRQEGPPRLPTGLRKVVPLPVKHFGRHTAENLMRYRNAARQARPLASWAISGADKGGAKVVEGFEAWVPDHTDSFFALFNLIETHGPHLAPKEWAGRDLGALAAALRHPGQTWARRMNLHNWGYKRLSEKSLERLRRAYRAEVRYADHLVGRIVAALDKAGVLDSTVVMVAGDHGEAFGEAGLVGHGLSLGQSVAHVPLVAAGPGVRHEAVRDPVGLNSFAATAAEALTGAAPFPAGSLFSSAGRGRASMEVEAPWLHFHPGAGLKIREAPPGMDRPAAAFFEDNLKLIVGSFWKEALYDLDRDPGETRNLWDQRPCPEGLAEMRARWEKRLEDA